MHGRLAFALCLIAGAAHAVGADDAEERPARSEGKLRAGLRDGAWKFWRGTGTTDPFARGRYVRGKKHGRWTYFHEGGIKRAEIDCKAGVPHGAFREWDRDGTPFVVGKYVDGKMDGTWREQQGMGWTTSLYRRGAYISGNAIARCTNDTCVDGADAEHYCAPFGDPEEATSSGAKSKQP
jgi:hypothetical protein